MITFFSEHFWITKESMDQYWAMDIVINHDNPLFIDPFLLYASKKKIFRKRHENIIEYLSYLKDKSMESLTTQELKQYYCFSEVWNNQLWYSAWWHGKWLWVWFADILKKNLHNLFYLEWPKNPHLETLCIVVEHVWKDKISDFVVNLLLWDLAEYTEKFIKKKKVSKSLTEEITIDRAVFDYDLQLRTPKTYRLPIYDWNFILLTPKSILRQDENRINSNDLLKFTRFLPKNKENDQLRMEINTIRASELFTQEEKRKETREIISRNPQIIWSYVKTKEVNIKEAIEDAIQDRKVFDEVVENYKWLSKTLWSWFDKKPELWSFNEAIRLVSYFKDVIENKDWRKLFYIDKSKQLKESYIQLMFKFTFIDTWYDINAEASNWRWPVDFKVSMWAQDKTLIEFKKGSNSKLKDNLLNQTKAYQKANDDAECIKVVFCYTEKEIWKVEKIVSTNKIENVIIVDVQKKKSWSNIK